MNKINVYGDGLGILIRCEGFLSDNWATFASWYSLNKNLPDAKVAIASSRKEMSKWDLFQWTQRCRIPVIYYVEEDLKKLAGIMIPNKENLVISPYVMAVREYSGPDIVAANAKDSMSTFINYQDGCAKFVTSEWIKSWQPPFYKAVARFRGDDVTVNELSIFKLWEECAQLYLATH